MGSDRSEPKHIPALDGVRGVAILLVMILHLVVELPGLVTEGSRTFRLLWRSAHWTWVGVDLFFVLSGFLITGILLDMREKPGYFRTFYARRALRIFPLYYVVLAAVLLVLPAIQGKPSDVPHAWSLWSYTSNWVVALSGDWPYNTDAFRLNHLWSLAIEEQFYFLWPVLVLVLGRRAMLGTCAGAMLLALGLRIWFVVAKGDHLAPYVLTPCRIDTLAAGAAMAILARETEVSLHRARAKKALLVGGGMLVLLCAARGLQLRRTDPWIDSVGFSLLSICFAGVVALAASADPRGREARIWSHPVLRFLGRYSYGLYVYHFLLQPLTLYLLPVESVERVIGGPVRAALVHGVLAGAFVTLVAVASFHLLEKPFLRLKSRLPLVPARPSATV